MPSEAPDDTLVAPKIGGSVETRLAGCDHRISGRRTAASISSFALLNNIIDPDAADEASQAS
jgi:hypothetical protein